MDRGCRGCLATEDGTTLRPGLCGVGEKHLADIDHSARLVSLAERVADSAEGSGLPLFAGWRAEPRPELLSSRLIHLFSYCGSGAAGCTSTRPPR
jgi:Helix-turn-helix family